MLHLPMRLILCRQVLPLNGQLNGIIFTVSLNRENTDTAPVLLITERRVTMTKKCTMHIFQYNQNEHTAKCSMLVFHKIKARLLPGFSSGCGAGIRTPEVPESESGALPLGYIPEYKLPYKDEFYRHGNLHGWLG